MLPVVPERAIRVRRGIRLNTTQVEAAVVEAVAVLSDKSGIKIGLARQRPSTSQQNKSRSDDGVLVFFMGFQVEKAYPGQIPPTLPSGAGIFMGSELGATTKREAGVGTQGESICTKQGIRPSSDGANAVSYGDKYNIPPLH